jgi:uncharacterized protein YggT (Ycf19 family)
MAQDKKLEIDESRRIADHESIKGAARDEVKAEVEQHADRLDEQERARAAALGERMRERAVDEVVETETEVERARVVARISQVIDYVFYLIYGIIGLEILFELVGASQRNPLRRFIDALSDPLLAPFRNLVPDLSAGRFQFRFSYLIALLVYILLHLAINGLLRVIAQRKTAI